MVLQQKANNAQRITPLFNDVFIRVFGQEDSRKVTRSLINSIFRMVGVEEIGDIGSISAEHTDIGGSVKARGARYDVRIVSGNQIVDMEAQRKTEDIAERSLFYGAKIITSGIGKQQPYKAIPKTTVVMLLDEEPIFDNDIFVHLARLSWEENTAQPATDRLQVVLVELEKVRKRYNDLTKDILGNEALSWLYLLATGYKKETDVQILAEKFPTIEEFSQLYGIALDDPAIVKAYDDYSDLWREEQSWKDYFERLEREAMERCETLEREAAERCETLEREAAERCETLEREAAERCETLEREAADASAAKDKEAAAARNQLDQEAAAARNQLLQETKAECERMLRDARQEVAKLLETETSNS